MTDRKGQTWRRRLLYETANYAVFTVVKSQPPTINKQFWTHEIVYLEYENYPELVGKMVELTESMGEIDLFVENLVRLD